jgi:glycosyltransferase involved in cell wall biosynthesis
MKILISAPAFYPHSFGGGEIYVYHLTKELLRRGHALKVLTPLKWPEDKKSHKLYVLENYTYENIAVISISLNPDKTSFAEKTTGYGPVLVESLRKIISEYSPELIHINGLKSVIVSICNELQIPHVVTAHHTGIVCPAGGLVGRNGNVCKKEINAHNCIPCCCYRKRPKWYIGGLMGKIPEWVYRPLGKRLRARNKLSYILRGLITPWVVEESMHQKKIVLEKTQMIIAPSDFMQDLLMKGGCDPERIIAIPHGVEHLDRNLLEDAKGSPIRFGYVGRIDPLKGLHILLRAAVLLDNLSSFEIHIFGTVRNPWDEEYKKKTLNEFRDKVKIFDHGLIPHEKLSEAFAKFDVLIVPSILPEAFGLVVAEAFSAGKPVIVSNTGALAEQVQDRVNGFIVECNDPKALFKAMQEFINDPELIITMSKNIPHVKTLQEYVDEIEGIYKAITARNILKHNSE